jgi:hypothetical protein
MSNANGNETKPPMQASHDWKMVLNPKQLAGEMAGGERHCPQGLTGFKMYTAAAAVPGLVRLSDG